MRKPKYPNPTPAESLKVAAQLVALALLSTFFFRGLMWALEQAAW